MEQQDNIYVIEESVRQALIAIINKAVHPSISFDQIDSIRSHLESLKPVRVMEGIPDSDGSSDVSGIEVAAVPEK